MTDYAPLPPPDDPELLPQYLLTEFNRIRDALATVHDMDVLHSTPAKPRSGMIRYFDGTDAGTAEGLHEFTGGTWTKI